MTSQINFYEVKEDLFKAIIALLVKILSENKKTLIFSSNEQQIKDLDNQIWSYGRSKFIPHGTIFDNDLKPSRQPILISNLEENTNSADYMIFMNPPATTFIDNFSRSFHFFEQGNFPTEISPTNFFRKEAGKWEKITSNR